MAKMYEWEQFLTVTERATMEILAESCQSAKDELADYQSRRDTIRRKCVQRARNALNKEARRQMVMAK